jgi:hypothetical protein
MSANDGAQALYDQGITAELVEAKIRRAADPGGA